MRAQDIIRDIPSRFLDAGSARTLLCLASERCCQGKRVFPTFDTDRKIRGFVCTGCRTAWNITNDLWECTVSQLPQEYRDYFDSDEGIRALCAALGSGAPGMTRGH